MDCNLMNNDNMIFKVVEANSPTQLDTLTTFYTMTDGFTPDNTIICGYAIDIGDGFVRYVPDNSVEFITKKDANAIWATCHATPFLNKPVKLLIARAKG